MRTQSAAQKNSTPAVTQPTQPRTPWRVAAVRALPGYRLRVRFMDGTEGTVNLTPLVQSPGAGIFSTLANPSLFNQVFVKQGR